VGNPIMDEQGDPWIREEVDGFFGGGLNGKDYHGPPWCGECERI